MSFEYGVEVAKTDTGLINVDYYHLEARRLRSEYFGLAIKSGIKSLKNMFVSPAEINTSAVNMFMTDKLAK
jgi:hypothetical protein